MHDVDFVVIDGAELIERAQAGEIEFMLRDADGRLHRQKDQPSYRVEQHRVYDIDDPAHRPGA